jgi:type I restriction enzyme, S subunit
MSSTSVLGDAVDEITVGHVGSMANEYVESGIPFLRSLNVEPLNIKANDLKFITKEFHQKLKKSQLRPGDVVVVRTGKPGAAVVIPDWLKEANCSDLVIIRPGKRVDPHWLAYFINCSGAHHIASHLVGAVQQHFNVESARKMPLRLPPLEEQAAIANKLRAFDDKIELNRKMNDTIERMAHAIFKSWFIDFDPVHAKAEGRKPLGMDAATAALFPDSLEPSELGEVPKGWRIGAVLDVSKLISGGTPKTSESTYWDGEILWASAKDVSQAGAPFIITTERRITSLGLNNSSTKLIPALSTAVVARGATTGRFTMFGKEMAMNQTCYALSSTSQTPFFLNLLLSIEIPKLVSAAHGSVFDTITTDTFRLSKSVLPTDALMQVFERIAKPLYGLILSNIEESASLSETRDLLLPRLLSGELSIKEAV